MTRWKRYRKNGQPQFDNHHVHPRSRGGGSDGWNKRRANYNLHHGFNAIFMHIKVCEAITIIKHHWTDENGNLRYELLSEEQIKEWFKIFGTLNTRKAIEKLAEMAHRPEDREKYEAWLEKRREALKEFVARLVNQHRKGGDA